MKVRIQQFGPALGKLDENFRFHREKIQEAAGENIDLIVFPELSLTGYQLRDIVADVSLNPRHPILLELQKCSREIDIVAGFPYESPPGIFTNSAGYFSDGKLIHCHHKVQLPNFGMFEEGMIFKPGNRFQAFQSRGFTIGLLICREILFPVHAYLYYLQHCDLLIGISNSPFRGIDAKNFKSFDLWEHAGYLFSVFHHQNYLFVNRTGYEEGIGFGGGSFFAPAGSGITEKCPYYTDSTLDITVNPSEVREARIQGNYLRDEKPSLILKELQRVIHERH